MTDDKKAVSFDELFHSIQKNLQKNGGSEKTKAAMRAQAFSSLIADMKTSASFNNCHCNNKNIMNDSLACHAEVRSEKPQTTEKELANLPRENLLISVRNLMDVFM